LFSEGFEKIDFISILKLPFPDQTQLKNVYI